ncbi:hypothetical protein L7F22_016530 [Adiantum nelumboides]|nr:hypothetical protein [Adiantum nelumboides]
MDFIFDLPRTQTGNDGIWTIICRFNKQADFICVRKKIKPDQMARLFMSNIFKYHGMPQSIVSDRDPRMTSLFWRGLFENMGTTLKFSSSFHPQTDGQSEEAILGLLKCYVSEHKGKWEQYLPLVEYAYNNTVHSSTGKAPFEIVEGGKKVPPILHTKDKIFEADKYAQDLDEMYKKGDPLWAIKLDTVTMILNLSLNFLFVLPLTNLLGIHILESPAVHPTAEALFNLVMGWSIMFAPLLFTDERRKTFSGSLVALWSIQMFLTNTVLIPYMAIRLNHINRIDDVLSKNSSLKLDLSGVQKVMVSGARVLSVVCGAVGLISLLWFFLGRANEGFGTFSDRWTFFLEYLASDRPGYAFVWDICLYSVFQPWLIGDNLDKVDKRKSEAIGYLRYIPYLGLVAYLWGLSDLEESES